MTQIKRIVIHVEMDNGTDNTVIIIDNPKSMSQTIEPLETFEGDIYKTFPPGTMSIFTIESPANGVTYGKEL